MTKILSTQEIRNHLIENVKKEYKRSDLAGRIITVIEGYGKRDGFLGWVPFIFYRIWNAVKAIFGQSDWQLAKKNMVAEMKKSIADEQEFQNHLLPKKFIQKITNLKNEMAEKTVEVMFRTLVDVTYKSTLGRTEDVDSFLEKTTNEKMKEIKTLIDKTKEKIQEETMEYLKQNPPAGLFA